MDWKYGLKLAAASTLATFALLGLLGALDDALGQKGHAYIWAYCEDSEKGRADYELVKETIRNDDREGFMAIMLDPSSYCKDERSRASSSAVPVEVLEFLEQFRTPGGRCIQTVHVRDANGALGLSWVNCRGEPV